MGGHTVEMDRRDREVPDERDLVDTWDNLDAHLIGEDLPERLEDHDTAERMIRSVARRKRELARAEELARIQMERITEWIAEERKRLDTTYFESCLTDYHAKLLDQDPRAKTIKLPSGTLQARAGQTPWEIDAEAFMPWAETYAESLIRVKREPALDRIKAALAEGVDLERGVAVAQSGEIVPGIRVEPGGMSFRVKVGEGQ